jgi:tetratricopeptide (TPR) repeat protein
VKKTTRACFFILFFLPVLLYAQRQTRQPYWYTLEQGKQHFRNGSYGDALKAFEEARRDRETMYARMERDMIDLLSIPEVRRLGDSLEQVEAYIADRNRYEAAAALKELYYRIPKESLGNSAKKVLEELNRLKAYPEAEYWIGEVYRLEGETLIALGQYEKALARRDLLETPGFDVDILYKAAELQRLRQNYTEMEKRLLEIIEGNGPDGRPRDTLWIGDTRSLARNAMARTLETQGIGRFLTLYRYVNPAVERAHRLLGSFYYATGRHLPAADHLMFAFLIQTSTLIDEVLKHQFDYTFTGLDALMDETARRPAMSAYMDEVEYYKTVYYLGAAFYGSLKVNAARACWTFTAGRASGPWKARSELQLRSPFVEPALERP